MTQQAKKGIQNDAVDGTKIKLLNNQTIRARNFADSGDVDLFKLNASDQFEMVTLPQFGGSSLATLVTAQANAINSLLTGYSSGPGTVSASDSILQAIQKLNGNTALKFTLPSFTAGSIIYSDGSTLVQDNSGLFYDSATQRLFMGQASSIAGSNAGIQYSNATTANRAQAKLHSYFNGASIAGISTLTSRSGVVGTNSAIGTSQDYSKWTAQAAATTPGSAPISGSWAFKSGATINSLTVPSDFHISLTNLAGTLGDRFYLTSEGLLTLSGYGIGFAKFDASGNISSYTLISSDITTALGYTPPPNTRNINTTAPLTGGGDLSADRTIAIPAATTSVDGYLSAANFTTFNNKVSATRAINTTSPITGGGDLSADRTIAIPAATTSVDGYLSATDFTTFNNKVSATRSISTTAPLTGGGDLSANRTISIPVATGSVDGYLSSTDWTTFNNKQAAGNYITALSGDVVASGPGSAAATIQAGVVSNSKLANMATQTFKGRTTAGTGSPEDLSATQATAMLNVVVGDSGSGGTKGLVPAPAAGDAAANKFLKADGTFAVPSGTGLSTTLTSAHIYVGNGSNVATDVAVSGDLTLANTGAFTVAKISGTTVSGTTGSGNVVFSASPTLTGTIAAASATFSGTVNKITITQPATGATLTLVDGSSFITAGAFSVTVTASATTNATLPAGTNTLQASLRSFNNQTGTTYTFVLADGSGPGLSPLNTFANASPVTVTVPTNASVAFPIGTQIDCVQEGAGKVTFAAAGGVTIKSASSNLSIGAQYVGVTLIKTATDTWYLTGNLIA